MNSKVIAIVIALVIVAGVSYWLISVPVSIPQNGTMSGPAHETPATSTQTTASDAELDAQMNTIDTNLKGLDSDNAQADGALNQSDTAPQ